MAENIYTSGEYLEKNPTWHTEESFWKAEQVLRMLTHNRLAPRTVSEVGCGAGEVLRQLQERMVPTCEFWGYDISPQAFALAQSRANNKLHFKLLDIRQEHDVFFDLMLFLDIIEHLEDYYSFLREMRSKSQYKILHLPLDLSVQTILRRNGLLKVRQSYGHLHYFTKDIALAVVKESGYEVLDYFYTARALDLPSHELPRKLLRLPRKLLFAIHKDWGARILGGWSLLVLAK